MEKGFKNIIFPVVVMAVLLLGAVRTFFFPKEMNTYENRYSNQVPAFSLSAFLASEYQDGMESALADQIPLAQYGKKAYNTGTSVYLETLVSRALASHSDRYFNYRGLGICRQDMLLRIPLTFANYQDKLDRKIENYNAILENHPDVDFYMYYIEKDTDVSFETGQKLGIYEYLRDNLVLDEANAACYTVDTIDEFRAKFFLTDHHWNAAGAHEGYAQVLQLLGCQDAPLEHDHEITLDRRFTGSKAFEIGSVGFTDEMVVRVYDWPEMTITVNGREARDYGAQTDAAAELAAVGYSSVFGQDMGEIIFSTGREERESILVIGESYDNAILKLLASHYNNTYSIDLRYYEVYMDKTFDLSDYLDSHDIDKVLFIGNISFYANDTFIMED